MSSAIRQVCCIVLLGACLLGCAELASAGSLDLGSAAAAEEAESPKHEGLFRWINFFLLVGGLGFVLRKPMGEFFNQRSASIRKSLEEGRKALEASQAQLQAVEEKLQRFEEEIAAFKAAAFKEMQEERERLRQATAQEVEKILEAVRAQMETATKQARLELKLYGAQQAVELAQQLIAGRLDESAQKRLVSQFIAKLEAKQSAN